MLTEAFSSSPRSFSILPGHHTADHWDELLLLLRQGQCQGIVIFNQKYGALAPIRNAASQANPCGPVLHNERGGHGGVERRRPDEHILEANRPSGWFPGGQTQTQVFQGLAGDHLMQCSTLFAT